MAIRRFRRSGILNAIILKPMLMYLVIQSDLFGMVKWPCKRLSDLQLGDKKAPLNHLVGVFFFLRHFWNKWKLVLKVES